jgi:hypothetical protein
MSKFQCLGELVAQPNRLENRLFLANVTMPLQAFVWCRNLRESRRNQREKYGNDPEHVRPAGSQT